MQQDSKNTSSKRPQAMILATHLKSLHEAFAKSQGNKSSSNGKIRLFPFLPCDNNLSPRCRGSYNCEEKRNDRAPILEGDAEFSKNANSLIESENYIEWTLNALKQLLAMPYLQFLSHVVYNAALKEFLLSYLAHRERPPLLAKDEQLGLNKTTDALQENIMADFDKRVFLIYLRIVSVELNPYLPIQERDVKYSSAIQSKDNVHMKAVLEDNSNLKISLKNARKTEISEKQLVVSAENLNTMVETDLLSQIIELIRSLTLTSILKLPHIMDILALLGDNNIILGTELLSRVFTVLEIKCLDGETVGNDTMNTNPIYGVQLERVIEEIEVVSKQIYGELSKILSALCNDQSEEEKKENNQSQNKNKFKCVDLSASKTMKNPRQEEKLKTEKRILELQSSAKNNSKNSNNLQLSLISDKIIDQYLDLVLYLVDIVYSFSVFFQSAAVAPSHQGDKKMTKNVLSLSSIFCNFDKSNPGLYLSRKSGNSVINTFQYLYEEVIPFFDILLSEVMKELKGSEPKHSATPGFRKLQKCGNYLKIAKINNLKCFHSLVVATTSNEYSTKTVINRSNDESLKGSKLKYSSWPDVLQNMIIEKPFVSNSLVSGAPHGAFISDIIKLRGQDVRKLLQLTSGEGVDSSYLFEALADHPGLLKRQKEKVNVSKTTSATLTSTNIESPESVTLNNEENINAMKIIFPDYGAGFLEACLLAFDRNVDRTIDGLLSENLPPHLLNIDRSLKAAFKGKGGINAGKVVGKIGKEEVYVLERDTKSKELSKAVAIGIEREKERDYQLKVMYEAETVEDEYDDDYDDQYDDAAATVGSLGNSEIKGLAGSTGIMKLTKDGVFVSTSNKKGDGKGGAKKGGKKGEEQPSIDWGARMADMKRLNYLIRSGEAETKFWDDMKNTNVKGERKYRDEDNESENDEKVEKKDDKIRTSITSRVTGNGGKSASSENSNGNKKVNDDTNIANVNSEKSTNIGRNSNNNRNDNNNKTERKDTNSNNRPPAPKSINDAPNSKVPKAVEEPVTLTPQQKRYSAKKIDKHHQKDKSSRKFSTPSIPE